MEDFLTSLSGAALSFLKAADLHTVLIVTLLTFAIRRTLWPVLHFIPSFLVWIPLLLSFVITPYVSIVDEVRWGGTYYIRACIFNGTVAIGVWLLVVPHLLKKWPQLLNGDVATGQEDNHTK